MFELKENMKKNAEVALEKLPYGIITLVAPFLDFDWNLLLDDVNGFTVFMLICE